MFYLSGYTPHSETEPAPFLYYYSKTAQAFVIQRSDGSERRVLAEYLLPPGHSGVAGPGWSASGQWFAWFSGQLLSGPVPDDTFSSAMVVNGDTGNIIEAIENCFVDFLDWSPSMDLLLIGCYETYAEVDSYTYFIFDPTIENILFKMDGEDFGLTGNIVDITSAHWGPNGDNLIFYYASSTDWDEDRYIMKLLSNEGVLIAQREFYTRHLSISQPSWSENGIVVYFNADRHLVTEQLLGNSLITFDSNPITKVEEVAWIDWSPDGAHALVYEDTLAGFSDVDTNFNPVWLLSIPEQSLTHIAESAKPNLPSRWHDDTYGQTSNWSPDGKLAFIVDTEDRVFLVDPSLPDLILLHELVDSNLEVLPNSVRWSRDSDSLAVVEYSSSYWDPDDPSRFYFYDIELLEVSRTVEAHVVFDHFIYLTSEGSLVYSSPTCLGTCVLNLVTGVITSLRFVDPTNRIGSALEIFWLPEGDWIIMAGDQEPGQRLLNVGNLTNGRVYSLGPCNLSQACFGWLPNVKRAAP
ncbi:hypothetical protein HC928_07935 [bacterium]|nr:hypothetical protein [bacterium]